MGGAFRGSALSQGEGGILGATCFVSWSGFYTQGRRSEIIFRVRSVIRTKLLNYSGSPASLGVALCTELALSFTRASKVPSPPHDAHLNSSIGNQLLNILIAIIGLILPEHAEWPPHVASPTHSLIYLNTSYQVPWASGPVLYS